MQSGRGLREDKIECRKYSICVPKTRLSHNLEAPDSCRDSTPLEILGSVGWKKKPPRIKIQSANVVFYLENGERGTSRSGRLEEQPKRNKKKDGAWVEEGWCELIKLCQVTLVDHLKLGILFPNILSVCIYQKRPFAYHPATYILNRKKYQNLNSLPHRTRTNHP